VTANTFQPQTALSALPMILKKLLCSMVGYFDGNLHRFILADDGQLTLQTTLPEATLTNKNKPPFIIVARQCYSEKNRTYPVESKSELKKLMALEFSALTTKQRANTFYHNWGSDTNIKKGNAQSQVNIWQFNDNVPTSFLRLPESLLLALTTPEGQVIQVKSEQSTYVVRVNNVIHSLCHTAIIHSAQRFVMSIGVAQLHSTKLVENNALATQLAKGIKKLSLPIILSFLQVPKDTNRLQILKNIFIPFVMVMGVYLSVSSGYLVLKEYRLQQKLAEQSSEVSIALKQQVNFDKQLSRYTALKSFLTTQHTRSPLWLVMVELFPTTQFTNIRVAQNRVVLRGNTQKATELLEILSKSKQVKEAKFDFPIRKNRNKEVFVISFELLAPTMITAEPKLASTQGAK